MFIGLAIDDNVYNCWISTLNKKALKIYTMIFLLHATLKCIYTSICPSLICVVLVLMLFVIMYMFTYKLFNIIISLHSYLKTLCLHLRAMFFILVPKNA